MVSITAKLLVKMNKPLSSDAWSSFGVVYADNNKHNKEIKEAIKFLEEGRKERRTPYFFIMNLLKWEMMVHTLQSSCSHWQGQCQRKPQCPTTVSARGIVQVTNTDSLVSTVLVVSLCGKICF